MGSKSIRALIVVFAMATVTVSSPVRAQWQMQADLMAFRTEVMTALRSAQPERNFRPDPSDPARILSDGMSVDVTNIFDTVLAFPEEPRESIIAPFVEAVLQVTPQWTDNPNPGDLVVVLRSAEYIDEQRRMRVPLIAGQVTDGLYTLVMLNTPSMFMSVGPAMLPDMSEDEIFETGLANSSRFVADQGSEDYDGFTLYFVESDPDLTNALALVPAFWDIVRKRFGDDFVFAMPRRDQLFVFDTRRDGFMDDVERLIDVTFADRYNLLSPEIYALEDGRIVAVETP